MTPRHPPTVDHPVSPTGHRPDEAAGTVARQSCDAAPVASTGAARIGTAQLRWVRPGDDEGRISMFLLVIFMAFVLLAGITTDLGRVLHANARASDLAAKAARTGAQELDPGSIRAGANDLNPAAAEQAALEYVGTWRAGNPAGTEVSARAEATPAQIGVTVTWPVRFWLLAALRPSATVTQTRTANPATGP